MNDLKEFNLSFRGLKMGNHQFEYEIGTKFFEHFQYFEFIKADIKIDLNFEKKHNMFNLMFNSKGVVAVACDSTNEPFELKVKGNLPLIVKFGEEYNDNNDEILIIPQNEFQLNVSQFIYEMIVLTLPVKRVHPGIKDCSLKSEILNKLQEYKVKENTIDPRWAKLKELQSNKKI